MSADRFHTLRRTMVSNQLRTVAVDDPRVVSVFADVARERFVPDGQRDLAYADVQLALGGGRWLNTPMATARLINAAAVEPGDRALIVGAATGYSAAVMVALGARVTALEADPELATALRARLPDVAVVEGPLADGVDQSAPFDAIMIDGAVEQVPDALVAQLAAGGRLATGLVDDGVTRLAIGRRSISGGFGLTAFADVDCVTLPGFARPRAFVF